MAGVWSTTAGEDEDENEDEEEPSLRSAAGEEEEEKEEEEDWSGLARVQAMRASWANSLKRVSSPSWEDQRARS